jgi:uncharacterized membrane protein YdbT with pleckstrin-like domain
MAKEEKWIIHPSFFQYSAFFVVPSALFFLLFLGVDRCKVILGVWIFETAMVLAAWILMATTTYVIKPDRVEIKNGVFVRRSRVMPYGQIVNITCNQGFFQRLVGIGNVSIDTAGGKDTGITLAGICRPVKITEFLFALKNRGGV